jgi:hypothetical protein
VILNTGRVTFRIQGVTCKIEDIFSQDPLCHALARTWWMRLVKPGTEWMSSR